MSDSGERKPNGSASSGSVMGRGLDAWRAGVGVWTAAEEEGSKRFRGLVRRGEAYEAQRREQVEYVMEELGAQRAAALRQVGRTVSHAEAAAEQAGRLLGGAVAQVLRQANLPARSDVNALARKIDRLSEQVDRLARIVEAKKG